MRMDASENRVSYNSKSFRLSEVIENILQKESILLLSFLEWKLNSHTTSSPTFSFIFSKYGISTLAKECPITVIFLIVDKDSKKYSLADIMLLVGFILIA